MARYSRRTGPPADFELTAVFQVIPGLSLTRFFDDGEILVTARGSIFNDQAGSVFFRYSITIDGVHPTVKDPSIDVAVGFAAGFADIFVFPITRGVHTIALEVLGDAGVDDGFNRDTGILTVIQLPLWDQGDDIL